MVTQGGGLLGQGASRSRPIRTEWRLGPPFNASACLQRHKGNALLDLLGKAAGYPEQSGDPLHPFPIDRPRDGTVDQNLNAGHDRYG